MTDPIQEVLNEIAVLKARIDDPQDPTCTHCLNISICERYQKLKELGHPDFQDLAGPILIELPGKLKI